MLESFFNYLKYEKRASPETIRAYENDLEQCQRFIIDFYEVLELKEATFKMLRAWVVHLSEEQLASTSINRKIATIKSFFQFLMRKGIIETNPSHQIRTLKTAKKPPKFVEESKLVQLLDNFSFTNDFIGTRDKLTLELLYGTGIRLSELINLELQNIDFTLKHIKVMGKRSKERIIPIYPSLLDLIIQYQKIKIQYFEIELPNTLIISDTGKSAYPSMIYLIVKKYLEKVTTQDAKSPHTLRHSFATHLLNKGADLNAIKELLGHTSLAATQIYTHNSLDKLKEVFAQAHPKA